MYPGHARLWMRVPWQSGGARDRLGDPMDTPAASLAPGQLPPPARLALHITGRLEAYLAACQLGITMASLGLGWVGEPVVAALLEPLFRLAGLGAAALHGVSFAVGFLLFSSLHIVLGEQVPKTFAIPSV